MLDELTGYGGMGCGYIVSFYLPLYGADYYALYAAGNACYFYLTKWVRAGAVYGCLVIGGQSNDALGTVRWLCGATV